MVQRYLIARAYEKTHKKPPKFLRLGGDSGVSLWVCRSLPVSTNQCTKSMPWLEENLQTVDAGDADIADGADFVGAEKLDGSRTLIEIVL